MKHKKTLALLLAGMLGATTLVGCGHNVSDESDLPVDPETTTVIRVTNNDGGFGTKWLRAAAKRFEEAYAEESFADGKTGVYVDVEGTREERISSMATDAYHIYFTEQPPEPRDMAQGGTVFNINDVLTEKSDTRDGVAMSIEDKIPEENRSALKGRDGNYYALPHFELLVGLSYDQDLFEKRNLYFADESETAVVPFTDSFGSANFVANKSAKKHCGNDGVYGTDDDGLPTSLQDMLILCAKMKQLGIAPFTYTGMYYTYSTTLELALWASLAGYDEMRINYTFDGDMVVVDYDHPDGAFTSEPLFQGEGLEHIKKPRTKTIKITEATGYKIYDSAARYYATAFLEAIDTLEWFSQDSNTSTVSHTDAQGKFIYSDLFGATPSGMLIEGCYWWNESEEKANNLSDYKADAESEGKSSERNIAWMSLPTSVNGTKPVEGTVHAQTFLEIGASYAFMNGNIKKDDTETINACKKFLQFLYSDAELEAFTKSTGTNRALIEYPVYDSTFADMDNFQQSFQNVAKRSPNAKVVYAVANNATYLASPSTFKLKRGKSAQSNVVKYNGATYESHREAMKAGVSLRDIFEATRLTAEDWSTYYQG
ncbi:MAG: hypothetical protein IJA89_04315 [Clostridia bacterium]|nr:hypothetical protein [Clostridia bacterium]